MDTESANKREKVEYGVRGDYGPDLQVLCINHFITSVRVPLERIHSRVLP